MAYLKNSYEHFMQKNKRMSDEIAAKARFDEAERKYQLAMDPNSGLSPKEREEFLNERNRLMERSGGYMAQWAFSPTRRKTE